MTQRERQPTEAASPTAARPGLGAAPLPQVGRPPSWDAIYLSASPAQQTHLLDLARCQGILYAHQLPQPTNGPPRDSAQRFLARALTGNGKDLSAVRAAPLDAPALDAGQ